MKEKEKQKESGKTTKSQMLSLCKNSKNGLHFKNHSAILGHVIQEERRTVSMNNAQTRTYGDVDDLIFMDEPRTVSQR